MLLKVFYMFAPHKLCAPRVEDIFAVFWRVLLKLRIFLDTYVSSLPCSTMQYFRTHRNEGMTNKFWRQFQLLILKQEISETTPNKAFWKKEEECLAWDERSEKGTGSTSEGSEWIKSSRKRKSPRVRQLAAPSTQKSKVNHETRENATVARNNLLFFLCKPSKLSPLGSVLHACSQLQMQGALRASFFFQEFLPYLARFRKRRATNVLVVWKSRPPGLKTNFLAPFTQDVVHMTKGNTQTNTGTYCCEWWVFTQYASNVKAGVNCALGLVCLGQPDKHCEAPGDSVHCPRISCAKFAQHGPLHGSQGPQGWNSDYGVWTLLCWIRVKWVCPLPGRHSHVTTQIMRSYAFRVALNFVSGSHSAFKKFILLPHRAKSSDFAVPILHKSFFHRNCQQK